MPKLIRKLAITAKIETTYNTDAAPTGAANAMLIRNATLTPIQLDTEGRVLIRPYLGNDEAVVTGSYQMLQFEVELAGGGAAGTAPKYGPLLRACGVSETTNAGVSVVYGPVSSGFESLSIYCNYDGTNFKLTGARGSVSMALNSKSIPVLKFNFLGLYNTIADLVLPTVVLTGWQLPVAVNKQNTPTFTLHGYSGVMQSMSLDVKNKLIYRNLVNHESIQITDRTPDGTVSFESTDVATKDWWTTIRGVTTGALQLVHGTVAGNIVQIDAPKVQLVDPKFSDMDGIQMLDCQLRFLPGSSGNDEFTLTVK